MIDFDQREAQFARLREGFAAPDNTASVELPHEGIFLHGEENSETQLEQPLALTPEPFEPAPTVVYDARPGKVMLLDHPFTLGAVRVESVTLLPPASADVEAVANGRMGEVELHARMAGLPVAALGAMRWPDREMVTVVARLLAPTTGAN